MNTLNLNKTNIIEESKASHIEFFLEKEIDRVYNFKKGYKKGSLQIDPSINVYEGHFMIRGIFDYVSNANFDKLNGILTITGRDKWQRKISTKKIQLKLVGYKLPTTSIEEGWIWGNGDFE